MLPEGIEPMIPASKRLQTLTIDPASVELRYRLEPKTNVYYKLNIQFVPRSKHSVSVIKHQ